MTEPRMIEIAEQLLRRSKAGDITWEEVGKRANTYRTSLPDIELVIFSSANDYLLSLRDDRGVTVESLYGDPTSLDAYVLLREIFDIARHQALDIEGTIDKALDYLKKG